MKPVVRCDGCGWRDTVAVMAHLRAWYGTACPACGEGVLIDAREQRLVEALVQMEAEGLCRADGPLPPGWTRIHIDSASPKWLEIIP